MTPRDRLIAAGYLMAKHYSQAAYGIPEPTAFPFDQAARWWPTENDTELATMVAAFAHYIRESGDVPAARFAQMQELSRELSGKRAALEKAPARS
jgi:hypothetical protein